MKLNTKKIKSELKRLGMTQATLANKIDRTPEGLSFALTRQRASWKTIEEIARVFQLDPRDLLL